VVAILSQEIDAIHVANLLYWKSAGRELGREARVEYERRRERLEQIRREFLRVRSEQVRYIERKAS
jgi:hypothetical protein